MSCHAGPDIVENGLVFCYDMNNTQKSYKGMPITNQKSTILSNQITPSQNYTLTTFSWINITDILDITATKALSVLLTSGGQNGKQWYWVNQGNYQGKTITWSWYVKSLSGDVADTICIAEGGYGSGNTVTSYTATSQWKRVSVTRTINTSNSIALGSAQDSVILDKTLLYTGFQLEESSFATPFVNGTRSNTQAIIDLTNNNTITASNLSYNSDGSFSLDGTDDYFMTGPINGIGSSTTSFSMSVWVYPSSTAGNIISMSSTNPSGSWNMPPIAATGQQFFGKIWSNNRLYSSTYSLNTWYNLVLVVNYTTSGQYFYVNGNLTDSQTGITYGASGASNYLFFGQQNPGADNCGMFSGKIGDIKIYTNKALSAAEIAQNFNATRRIYGI